MATMKIKYKHQRFQEEAVRCVTDVFQGQPKSDGIHNFLIDQGTKRGFFNVEGFGNTPILLDRESLCENIRTVQMAQGLQPVDHIRGEGLTLTVEMETGTGKTYTYIKTMYELNRCYGWSKFIIIVPSIAIREGVFKSLKACRNILPANTANGYNISSTTPNSCQRLTVLPRTTAFT